MRRACAAALLLVLGGAASADTPATTQWVLATAKATGAGGEQFVSSLRISNPLPQPANVDLTYLAQSPIDPSGSATGSRNATGIPTGSGTPSASRSRPASSIAATRRIPPMVTSIARRASTSAARCAAAKDVRGSARVRSTSSARKCAWRPKECRTR